MDGVVRVLGLVGYERGSGGDSRVDGSDDGWDPFLLYRVRSGVVPAAGRINATRTGAVRSLIYVGVLGVAGDGATAGRAPAVTGFIVLGCVHFLSSILVN